MAKLPFLYQKWLDQYELTANEQTLFSWSKHQNRMIFLVKIRDRIVFWEGRSLTEQPKSLSFGKKPYVLFYQGMMLDHLTGHSVVIVEDIVSAIKVGRYVPALPLFGSNLQKDHALKLAQSFKNIYIWLDDDKFGKSVETTRELRLLGVNATSILTKEDPKCYSKPDEILTTRGVINDR